MVVKLSVSYYLPPHPTHTQNTDLDNHPWIGEPSWTSRSPAEQFQPSNGDKKWDWIHWRKWKEQFHFPFITPLFGQHISVRQRLFLAHNFSRGECGSTWVWLPQLCRTLSWRPTTLSLHPRLLTCELQDDGEESCWRTAARGQNRT